MSGIGPFEIQIRLRVQAQEVRRQLRRPVTEISHFTGETFSMHWAG